MKSACCSDLSNLEKWDCACSWGCDCCDISARCKVCKDLMKHGRLVELQRAAGLCADPFCKTEALPKSNRCWDHLSRKKQKNYRKENPTWRRSQTENRSPSR